MPLTRNITRIVLATLLALAVVSILAMAAVSAIPGACASCHSMRPFADSSLRTAHDGEDCYACHLSSPADLPRMQARFVSSMVPAAVLGRGVSDGARTTRAACLRCHADVLERTLDSKGLRIRHQTCAPEKAMCDSCHNVHGRASRWARQPVMEDCVLCHIEKAAVTGCDACHSAKGERERLAAGPWQVSHGKNWRQTHGMGSVKTCVVCHPDDFCVRCHKLRLPHPASFASGHGKEGLRKDVDCEACHDRASFCDECHKTAMPHPAGFLAGHSRTASGTADAACLACHLKSDCEACHVRHTHPGNTKGALGKPLPTVKNR